MGAVYDVCRARVTGIQAAYEALLDEVDAYEATLGALGAEGGHERKLALGMQQTGLQKLRDALENETLDTLIRFADRVIRIKHWEDGVFL